MTRFTLFVLLTLSALAQAQKRIPPPGITISDADRAGLSRLLEQVKPQFQQQPDLAVRWKAVDWALRYNEFFRPEDLEKARLLLDPAFGHPNLQVHGFRSDIDDSWQPYGLVLPPSFAPNAKGSWRLDVWLHGRGETTTELNFIYERLTRPGEFTPADTIVLHPFGRWCNAFKFAGETDVWEAVADVQRRYRIDPDRIAIRGFSMGGAGAWHLAAHHPGAWAAATPGAGFVDTEEYQKLREKAIETPWYERALWPFTNAKEYALNFFNLPVIAYSGDEDPQKAAADIMARELAAVGVPLRHVIGPKTGHRYEPGAKRVIDQALEPLMQRGRQIPAEIRFTTYTTRWNRSHWVSVQELTEHWTRAEVDARIVDGGIVAETKNVNRIEFAFRSGEAPFRSGRPVRVRWNGSTYEGDAPSSDGSWRWISAGSPDAVHKRPALQGPIDDAFTSRFVFVRPAAGAPAWIKSEFDRAVETWRRIFRGDALVRTEDELTADDRARANIVLWGTPDSSRLLRQWAPPVPWPVEPDRYLVAIYPNPEQPSRYVVLNSGHTFREPSEASNALQVAKLPDWAIIQAPYQVVDAGFFDESWKPKATSAVRKR